MSGYGRSWAKRRKGCSLTGAHLWTNLSPCAIRAYMCVCRSPWPSPSPADMGLCFNRRSLVGSFLALQKTCSRALSGSTVCQWNIFCEERMTFSRLCQNSTPAGIPLGFCWQAGGTLSYYGRGQQSVWCVCQNLEPRQRTGNPLEVSSVFLCFSPFARSIDRLAGSL